MKRSSRGARVSASILVSLTLGAIVLGFLLVPRDHRAQPRSMAPPAPPAKAKSIPKPPTPKPSVLALKLPPPPRPESMTRTKSPKRKKNVPAPPKPAPAKIEARKRAVRSERPRTRPKHSAVKPSPIEAPALTGRRPKAPIPLAPKPKSPAAEKRIAATPSKSDPTAGAGTVVPTRAVRREGRALLRLLEYGKGPTIEIAWPDNEGIRNRLYRSFRECYGMRNAVMAPDGRLYGETGQSGKPWPINLDRYSGFIRQPVGRTIAAERTRTQSISNRHGVDGRPVRVFPRRVDAVILGGLNQVIGGAYRGAKTITASYEEQRGRLILGAIRVDGRLREGAVDISMVRSPGCVI